jgi:hypothetical protein
MSLQHVAKHLASKGRGEDKVLVHMTPREVKGLQSLAMAHGGSLTINPHTGLAEAGFLRSLLPALAGAGLMMIPGMQALGAAAIVGGGTALAKGDLKAGLMAGLGAYGGAGLAEGAMAGAATPPPTSSVPAAPDLGIATATPIPPQGPVQGMQLGSLNETGQAASGFQPSGSAFQSTMPDPSAMTAPPAGSNYMAPSGQSGMMDARSAYDPSFQAQPYGGPTEASLKPEATGFERAGQNFMKDPKLGIAAIAPGLLPDRQPLPEEDPYSGPLSKYKFDPDQYRASGRPQPNPYYQARMYDYAGGGPVEQMSNANAIGANTGYPMSDINKATYSTPYQTPISQNVVQGSADTGVNPMTGEQSRFAGGGGISSLGSYSDGGRMLKGPGDGMSDNIPAQIGSKQPARLADGEFVVPADVVSHLGNGSTDAGARQLYGMMDRIRSQRTGKKKQAPRVNPKKAMPV